MKVLVTGASGFIGSNLLKALCQQYGNDNVIALSTKNNKECNTIIYSSDYSISACDYHKLNDVELLIHAGAYTPKNRQDINNVFGANSNILFINALLKSEVKSLTKILYISTLDVYDSVFNGLINEDTAVKPMSLYGASKVYCESMIQAFCEERKIACQILRLGHVYGPGEEQYEKIIPLSIKKMLLQESIEIWGDGSDVRSFIYIDDVITAIINSIELKSGVGVINVVSANSITIKELLIKCGNLIGYSDFIYKEYSGAKRDLLFDTQKLQKYLLQNETSLEDGLQKEINYFKGLM